MKNILISLVVLFTLTTTAQNAITANVTQDAKLAFFGDDKGNEAFTPDVAISSEWQGKQFNSYYFLIRPEFEIAELQGGTYRRYSANLGWTFNQWVEGVNFTASIGYGILEYNGGYSSFGSNLQTSIELTKDIEFVLDLETVERKDLLQYSSTNEVLGTAFRVSGKFGLKIKIFRPKEFKR